MHTPVKTPPKNNPKLTAMARKCNTAENPVVWQVAVEDPETMAARPRARPGHPNHAAGRSLRTYNSQKIKQNNPHCFTLIQNMYVIRSQPMSILSAVALDSSTSGHRSSKQHPSTHKPKVNRDIKTSEKQKFPVSNHAPRSRTLSHVQTCGDNITWRVASTSHLLFALVTLVARLKGIHHLISAEVFTTSQYMHTVIHHLRIATLAFFT